MTDERRDHTRIWGQERNEGNGVGRRSVRYRALDKKPSHPRMWAEVSADGLLSLSSI